MRQVKQLADSFLLNQKGNTVTKGLFFHYDSKVSESACPVSTTLVQTDISSRTRWMAIQFIQILMIHVKNPSSPNILSISVTFVGEMSQQSLDGLSFGTHQTPTHTVCSLSEPDMHKLKLLSTICCIFGLAIVNVSFLTPIKREGNRLIPNLNTEFQYFIKIFSSWANICRKMHTCLECHQSVLCLLCFKIVIISLALQLHQAQEHCALKIFQREN